MSLTAAMNTHLHLDQLQKSIDNQQLEMSEIWIAGHLDSNNGCDRLP